MNVIKGVAVACLATVMGAVTPPAPEARAEVGVTAETVANRINLAGRQRMLAERMALYFCYARSGVEPAASVGLLQKSIELFAKTHRGFVEGDDDQELFAENDASVIAAWEQVDLMWGSLDAIYARALSGDLVSEADFDRAMRMTLEVRNRANDMVAQLRAAYAGEMGDKGFGNALLLDLYGRQRMLSQKLSKEVCLVARGHKLDDTRPELASTLELFENSLRAFREGMPIAGVPKPPSAEIAAQLDKAHGTWVPIRLTAAKLVNGNAATLTELGEFKNGAGRFLVEMNKAVGMLAKMEKAGS